jgi:hypothetical protein
MELKGRPVTELPKEATLKAEVKRLASDLGILASA